MIDNIEQYELVSVIIPLHNAERFIAETIENVLSQTYQNIEVIVIDDGSTDNSLAVAKAFENNKVKIFTQPNKGASAARNYGLRESKGEFIQFLDADDLLSTNKIEEQLKLLRNVPDKIATSFTVHFFDSKDIGNEQSDMNHPFLFDCEKPSDFLLNLYGGNGEGGMITIHSWLTPKKLIERAGYWNEKLSVDDDGEFFCRVLLASDGILFANNVINYYRKFRNSASLSSQVDFKSIRSTLESLKLKENHLANYKNDNRYKKAFALAYKRLAVRTYPRFKDISKLCEDRMKKLGGSSHDVTIGGKQIEFVKRIAGWKVARSIQHSLNKN